MFGWLKNILRRSAATSGLARVILGDASAGRVSSRSRLLLKKQLWVWPIIAVVLLAAVGFVIGMAIERTMKASLKSELATLVSLQRSMLETWLKIQESNAQSLANDPQVREIAAQIIPATSSLAASAGAGIS